MKQQTFTGDRVPVDERKRKHRHWARCRGCQAKVFEGGTHKCKKTETTVTFEELNKRE